MAVPDFQTMMLPVLRMFSDGLERQPKDVRASVAEALQLSAADKIEMLASGRQTRFANRVAWGLFYLTRAALLETPRRSVYRITERGQGAVSDPPLKIDISFLMRYPEFVEFRNAEAGNKTDVESSEATATELTPDEQIRAGYERLKRNLAAVLLEKTKQAGPQFFENLVVQLLVNMGYGGSHEDAASVVGQSGDGGIDGIIKEDRLGLDEPTLRHRRWFAATYVMKRTNCSARSACRLQC